MSRIECRKCGSVNIAFKDKGPHKGAYCGDCGSWIKWVSKKDIFAKPAVCSDSGDADNIKNDLLDKVLDDGNPW